MIYLFITFNLFIFLDIYIHITKFIAKTINCKQIMLSRPEGEPNKWSVEAVSQWFEWLKEQGAINEKSFKAAQDELLRKGINCYF